MLLVIAPAALLLAACAGEPAAIAPRPERPGAPTFYDSMAKPGARLDAVSARDMISLYRSNHGLEALIVDPGLMAEAQAEAMARSAKLSHEVRGNLTARLDRAGYAKSRAVENVSAGYHTLAEAFSGWRQSPPHNANMLAPGMRRLGVAAAYNPATRYKVFWTLVLAN
jgi:uncharacterized protein YkwD